MLNLKTKYERFNMRNQVEPRICHLCPAFGYEDEKHVVCNGCWYNNHDSIFWKVKLKTKLETAKHVDAKCIGWNE